MRTIVFLLLLVLVVYLVRRAFSGARQDASRPTRPKAGGGSERMIACLHCGLHVPESEAVQDDGRAFCCREHLRLHRGPDA